MGGVVNIGYPANTDAMWLEKERLGGWSLSPVEGYG